MKIYIIVFKNYEVNHYINNNINQNIDLIKKNLIIKKWMALKKIFSINTV